MQESLDLAKRLASERDHLERSRDVTETKFRVVEKNYQDLLIELNQLKLSDKCHVSQLESELKLKKFEVNRLTVLYSESEGKFKSALLEKERLAEKLDVLREEFSNSMTEADRKITTLTLQLQDKSSRLEAYDKLEAELDKVVMQAAALPSNQDADEILSAYGYGANIPSDAKRRLQQSLSLARRVLELEHRAAEHKNELFNVRDRCQILQEELDAAKSAFRFSGHPTSQLLDVIKKRDMEIGKLKDKVKGVELSLERVTKSNFQLQAQLTKGNSSVNRVYRNRDFEDQLSSHLCTSSKPNVFSRKSSSFLKNRPEISQNSAKVVHIKKPLSFSKLNMQGE